MGKIDKKLRGHRIAYLVKGVSRLDFLFLASITALALLHSTASALNECMATLKDPHGSVEVRCDGGTKATLKGGEHFLAQPRPDGWNAYLKSGCSGFIGKAKLQLLPNKPVMKLNLFMTD